MPPPPDLSLVVPCYNEATHLRASVQVLLQTLDGSRLDYEVVFVDDFSQDDTRSIIAEICADSERCRAIYHARNRGRGGAFKAGFQATSGVVTGFLDIDLEIAPHYILPLVHLVRFDGHDVATGKRFYLLRQTRAIHRHLLSQAYRRFSRTLLGLEIEDSETGCKFFRRETASEVVLGSGNDGWFWDTEVMARAALAGLRIVEMPVLFLRRLDCPSSVRILRDSWHYLVALLRFRTELVRARQAQKSTVDGEGRPCLREQVGSARDLRPAG